MIQTNKRVTFDLKTNILDTLSVDNDTIKNGVIISFRDEPKYDLLNMSTYELLIADRQELNEAQHVNVLVVIAKEGHKIYNYDKCYNFYLGTVLTLTGELITLDITNTVTNREIDFIHNIMWGHRDVLPTLRAQAKDNLSLYDNADEFMFHSHCIESGDYKGAWKSTKHRGGIYITIKNYKSGISKIEIEDERF